MVKAALGGCLLAWFHTNALCDPYMEKYSVYALKPGCR